MNSKDPNEEDFICWVSEDPDDWNSFSDYERKLRFHVHEYNEEACCLGDPLLGVIGNDLLNTIVYLSELRADAMSNPELRKRLEEIRRWAKLRMESCHPDDLGRDCFGNAAYQEGMSHWKAKEYEKAISCFEDAALFDNEKAYFMLCHVFENGFVGMKKDLDRIVGYYRQGVEDEVPFCEWRLGRLYLHGLIGPSDRKLAFPLIHRAALHGSGAAAKELPDLYREGIGCEVSPAKADYWEHVSKVLSGEDDNNEWKSRCVETGLLERYFTAGQIHYMAMNDSEYWWDEGLKQWRTRVKPTEEQAKDYVRCVKMLLSYSNCYPKGVSPIDDKEARLLEEKVKAYEDMHLDMRDVLTLDENFHFSLRRVTGEVVVSSLNWPTERYDYIESIRESWGAIWCVPVRKQDKYALCKMDGMGKLITGFDYDHMYRYFGSNVSYFVVEQKGKKGLISQTGRIIIPCEMDEIYEMIDADGIVPFKKGDKWGMAFVGNQLPTSVNAISEVGMI